MNCITLARNGSGLRCQESCKKPRLTRLPADDRFEDPRCRDGPSQRRREVAAQVQTASGRVVREGRSSAGAGLALVSCKVKGLPPFLHHEHRMEAYRCQRSTRHNVSWVAEVTIRLSRAGNVCAPSVSIGPGPVARPPMTALRGHRGRSQSISGSEVRMMLGARLDRVMVGSTSIRTGSVMVIRRTASAPLPPHIRPALHPPSSGGPAPPPPASAQPPLLTTVTCTPALLRHSLA
jgi:hypothetical protein